MSKTVLVVHVDVDPARRDEFIDIVTAHGERSMATEPGCLRFEVLLPQEREDQVTLIEVYRDREALDSHWASAHMAAYRERVADLLRGRDARICTLA